MKVLKRMFTFAVIVLCIWFVASWFEIAFHCPIEPTSYSNYNLLVPMFKYFL